jgi:hypothetical protein
LGEGINPETETFEWLSDKAINSPDKKIIVSDARSYCELNWELLHQLNLQFLLSDSFAIDKSRKSLFPSSKCPKKKNYQKT